MHKTKLSELTFENELKDNEGNEFQCRETFRAFKTLTGKTEMPIFVYKHLREFNDASFGQKQDMLRNGDDFTELDLAIKIREEKDCDALKEISIQHYPEGRSNA